MTKFTVDFDNFRSVLQKSDELKVWVAMSAFQPNEKGELIYRFEDLSSCLREMINFIMNVPKGALKKLEPKLDYTVIRFKEVDRFIQEVDVKDCLEWRSHNIGYLGRIKMMELLARLPIKLSEIADILDQTEIEKPELDETALKAAMMFAASVDSIEKVEKKLILSQKIGWIWRLYQAEKK